MDCKVQKNKISLPLQIIFFFYLTHMRSATQIFPFYITCILIPSSTASTHFFFGLPLLSKIFSTLITPTIIILFVNQYPKRLNLYSPNFPFISVTPKLFFIRFFLILLNLFTPNIPTLIFSFLQLSF